MKFPMLNEVVDIYNKLNFNSFSGKNIQKRICLNHFD